jgi:hypothetical protein
MAQTTYSTGSYSEPRGVAVVDVNSDSKLDIIVANSGSDTVGVLLNTGNGTFAEQTNYSTGSGNCRPQDVAVVDVNNDSKPDIIVTNANSNNVGIFLNTGNGTFTPQTNYSTGSNSYPFGVAVVDVNSDSIPDIIVANSVSNNVGIFLNTGNGTFTPQTTYSTGNTSYPWSVAVVDVNNDSKPDIIVANYNRGNVGVLLNAGNGTFTAQITYSTGSNSNPQFVAVVDVNSDSKPDIIVTNLNGPSVGVLLNTGNGTFTAQTTYSTGTALYGVAVADVNSDSKPDIIVTNYASDSVGVLLAYCN